MNPNLERYLNDHLGGSAGAVDLIQAMADAATPEHAVFFRNLKAKVEEDRMMLQDLLERIGHSGSSLLQAAGNLTAKAGRLKLMWEGLDPGRLGLFEAMEMLVLGIQGKRLLWKLLGELSIPGWQGIDFKALEEEALRQRNAVEEMRMEAGREALR